MHALIFRYIINIQFEIECDRQTTVDTPTHAIFGVSGLLHNEKLIHYFVQSVFVNKGILIRKVAKNHNNEIINTHTMFVL